MDKHIIITLNIMRLNELLLEAQNDLEKLESQRDWCVQWIEAKKNSLATWKEELEKETIKLQQLD